MPYFVYMIVTNNKGKKISYVGFTNNLAKRLNLHNQSKGAKFTRGRKWHLIYCLKFKDKIDALKYEYKLKRDYKLRKLIKEKYLTK